MSQAPQDLQRLLQDVQARLVGMDHQLLQSRKMIAGLQAELAVNRQKRELTMPMEFTSQFGEDALIWNILGQQTAGFFIEAGAFDGYRYSVTYPLEAAGWTGLLVEAIPERASQCAQLRKGSRVVNAALARRGSSGAADFWIVNDQYGGMLSHGNTTPLHLQEIAGKPKTKVTVPVTCLDDLLKDHQGEIDLLVLDVEGGEMEALAGFDVARFKPRIMLIEDNSKGQNQAIHNFMRPFPYTSVGYLVVNNVLIRNDQTEVFERLKWLMGV